MLVERAQGAQKLFAVDRRAAALGLVPGLSLAEALARIRPLAVVAADPAADAAWLAALATLCERFTPLVALDPPEGLLLDITGCAQLFGGEAGLRADIRKRLRQVGLTVRDGIGQTPDAARALARFGEPGAAPDVTSLPIAALGLPPATMLALSRTGLSTIGDLAARPMAGLAARFGADLPQRLARVLGQEDVRIVPRRPPAACTVERHFLEPIVQAQAVERVLDGLMREVADLLAERGLGGSAFEASLFRSDGQIRRILVETSGPSRDVAAILRLFALRIDALNVPVDAGFGIDAVRLAVMRTAPLAPAQPDLDNNVGEAAHVFGLVDRLVARFGGDRVLRFAARDTHHPTRVTRQMPAQQPTPVPRKAHPKLWAPPAGPPGRPLSLFDPPLPIEVLAEVPDGAPVHFRWRRALHNVTRAEGPERIAPEWWHDEQEQETLTRDYYRLEDAQGRRFWVFREGLHAETACWFLHGLFA